MPQVRKDQKVILEPLVHRGQQAPKVLLEPKGETGPQGPQGIQGQVGPQGPKGTAAIVGVTVAANGFFTFSGDSNGDMWCYYSGGTAPEFDVTDNGDIYIILGG